jgi:hypothetical protein
MLAVQIRLAHYICIRYVNFSCILIDLPPWMHAWKNHSPPSDRHRTDSRPVPDLLKISSLNPIAGRDCALCCADLCSAVGAERAMRDT